MRLDIYLHVSGLCRSRSLARRMIESGEVTVNGIRAVKQSLDIEDTDKVEIDRGAECTRYVSRGGLKLEAALRAFSVSCTDRVCIDVGASSGGFTDCLLRHGARLIYAVDSGHGQLDPTLKDNSRIIEYENYNARYLRAEDFSPLPNLAVMDVSFISQTMILPSLSGILAPGSQVITLIKPQFELTRAAIGKNGIVHSERDRAAAVSRVRECACQNGMKEQGFITSPITGGDGNTEYLIYFEKQACK